MANEWPSEVDTFTVVGRLIKGISDSPDEGTQPEVLPIVGATVIFSPDLNPPIYKVPNAGPKAIVFQNSIVCTTDAEGFLVLKGSTDRGVVLPFGGDPDIIPSGWTWRVIIQPGGNFPEKIFSIYGSQGVTIDLASVVPVPADAGTEIPLWVKTLEQIREISVEVEGNAADALQSKNEAQAAMVIAVDKAGVATQQASLSSYHSTAAGARALYSSEQADRSARYADEAAGHEYHSNVSRELSADAATQSSTSALTAAQIKADIQQIANDIEADRGVPNGLAILDGDGKLPSSMLPESLLEYMGTWDPRTNTPTLSDATGENGNLYYVEFDGTRDLGSGPIEFKKSDRLAHNGDIWQKWDTTDAVTSVAGKSGAVILVKSDVGLSNVDNTSDANKPVSIATQEELNKGISNVTLQGDNLVFTTVGGSQITTGSVRGAKGDSGDYTAAALVTEWGAAYNIAPQSQTLVQIMLNKALILTMNGTPIPGAAYTKTIVIKQAASGGPFMVTWPVNIQWVEGTPPPEMPTVPGARLVVHLLWDGGQWTGLVAGRAFP